MPRTRSGRSTGSQIEFLAARKGEHALRQRRAALRAADGIVDQASDWGHRAHALASEFEAAEDRHQQVVEIVRDAAGELADGIHLLRLEQRLARLLQRALRLPPLGDVARDLGEADRRSPWSSRIASMTTLAQKRVPSLRTRQPSLLEPSFARGGLQAPLRARPLARSSSV